MIRNRISGMMIIMLVLSLVLSSIWAYAEEIPVADSRSQTVRVYLSRLGIRDRMDLTLGAPYQMVTDEGMHLHFQAGCELAFLLRDDDIYVYYQGMALQAGNGIVLTRTQEDGGFYLTNYPALYEGDLTLRIADGILQPVLAIHVEDYLLGVVPNEMGDSFPLEALKAQTVAARNYALSKQNPDAAYDVVDTTNDQVFKGYLTGSPVSEQAVAETRGISGFYKGQLAKCYYSASNGGQMELPVTVWPDVKLDYYTFGADPYDVANPLSMVRRFELLKKYDEEAPEELRALLAAQLAAKLEASGYQEGADNIRVDEVLSVRLSKPTKKNSILMTMLDLTVRISGRAKAGNAAVKLADADPQEVSIFIKDTVPTPEPVLTAEEEQVPFTPLAEELTVQIPIFQDAENAFDLNVTKNYENEIWTVVEEETKFVLEARRYGHGVGMSQRGAEWMAINEGKSYQDILAFYYPGMKLMQYPETEPQPTPANEALLSTAGPAPSPTPRPTLIPVTLQAENGQWIGAVTEIADDSSLNLREKPSLNAAIVRRLYKGQRLLVMEDDLEGGWAKVKTDAAEGYVMGSYLTREP